MVSFQCHACGDVVKKPKLDQHRGRCHTGFDCIDCHTTFNGPAEYKGHTQCITEAEKYQKSLYKGPKITAAPPRNNYPPLPADSSIPSRPSWAPRGRGGYGYGAGWGRSRTSATGANDTPLGTPARNSPVPPPPPKTSIIHQVKTDVLKPPEVPEAATDNSNPLEKKEKDKKRKSTIVDEDMATATKSSHVNGDEPRSKKAKITNDAVTTNPASIPLPASPVRSVDQHRKEKKSTKDKHGDKDEKKNKRRESKKSKLDGTDGEDIEMSAPIDKEMKEERKHKKSKKDKREKDGESREESNGKSKKRQRDVVDVGTNGPVDKEMKEVERKSKQSKKQKREKHDESREEPSETSKKRKRDVVEVDGKGEGEVGETKSKGRKGDADAMEIDSPSGKSKIGKNKKLTKDKKDKKVRAPDFVAEITL